MHPQIVQNLQSTTIAAIMADLCNSTNTQYSEGLQAIIEQLRSTLIARVGGTNTEDLITTAMQHHP